MAVFHKSSTILSPQIFDQGPFLLERLEQLLAFLKKIIHIMFSRNDNFKIFFHYYEIIKY